MKNEMLKISIYIHSTGGHSRTISIVSKESSKYRATSAPETPSNIWFLFDDLISLNSGLQLGPLSLLQLQRGLRLLAIITFLIRIFRATGLALPRVGGGGGLPTRPVMASPLVPPDYRTRRTGVTKKTAQIRHSPGAVGRPPGCTVSNFGTEQYDNVFLSEST